MNSDASDAYLQLGRDSMQLAGDESWLDELSSYETAGLELDDEVRRLVGTVSYSSSSDSGSVEVDHEATPRAAHALGGQRGVREDDAMAGAEKSESSLWDESDAFWSSCTPPPEIKPQEPCVPEKSRKRHFVVRRDELHESPVLGHAQSGKKHDDALEAKGDRVLGLATPNGGARMKGTRAAMTPGAYYDEQGFLRA
ncbi:hypothetical protein N0V86_007697 [Didymella sp. IMI 355093]|nr:hypothetical protein N0V86_007697 [Didymella sp. IMI 355093]